MGISTEMFRKIDQLSPELKDVFMTFVDEMDKSVKKEDFDELKELVSELAKAQKRTENSLLELAEAQKRTEEKLEQLTIRVDELAEIQKKTEKKLNELAEAQKKTEEKLNELAEAQKKTEEKLNELAEAQKKTEKKLNELAEAQKKTEEELKLLVKEHKRTREILGGLSDIVGYGIEDQIAPFIFDFSQKEFGVEVQNITRKNLVYPDGAYDEVNIFAEGKKNGEKVYLIGECKTRPGKKDVDKFYSRLLRIRGYLNTTVYPFFVGYVYHPEVENYIQEKYPDLKYLKSIDFFVNYKKRWD